MTWNWSQALKHRQFRENVDPQILHKIPNCYLTIERKGNALGHLWRPSVTWNWSKALRHRQFRENVDPHILHKIPN